MEFLYILVALIVVSIITFFLIQKLGTLNWEQRQRFIVWTYRVKGTARGANGRFESSKMLENRRKKVNGVRSKF